VFNYESQYNGSNPYTLFPSPHTDIALFYDAEIEDMGNLLLARRFVCTQVYFQVRTKLYSELTELTGQGHKDLADKRPGPYTKYD
jgi:hypothetical protein